MGNSPARIAELISGEPPMNTGRISKPYFWNIFSSTAMKNGSDAPAIGV
jgi:hypothetical protein